ncbi:protease inhibitor I42 family protein [Edaphobacter aggregans]|uniref:protease inhibitor I42 family protein n=1 Tax=Edaphobacter aggregans TaxID=570835 RepID=UPI001470575F|nr:protease inhibitor I42 family protein [Edaphobacter aggregans]
MTITVTEQNDGGQVRAQVGDTLELHLAENATTGYRWEPDNLDTHLFELEEATANYPSGVVGSGGDAQFRIKVLAAGSATLRLKYWRRWEGESGVLKRFSVKIDAS